MTAAKIRMNKAHGHSVEWKKWAAEEEKQFNVIYRKFKTWRKRMMPLGKIMCVVTYKEMKERIDLNPGAGCVWKGRERGTVLQKKEGAFYSIDKVPY